MRNRQGRALEAAIAAFMLVLLAVTAEEVRHRQELRQARLGRMRQAVELLAPMAVPLFAVPVAEADARIRCWAAASGLRVTLIAPDGRVIADSWTLPNLLDRLENHGHRPEVLGGAAGGTAMARRRSVTTDTFTLYVARQVPGSEGPAGTLRLAIDEGKAPVPWTGLMIALLGAGAAWGWASWRLARLHRVVGRHLSAWTELPTNAELEAIAEEADRRFRVVREELGRELAATRAALAEVSEGVMLLDHQGVVRYCNPAAQTLAGPDLTVGRPLVEAVREPELLATVSTVAEHGGSRHTSLQSGRGGELAVRVCAVPHPVLPLAVVVRDISGERQLERARRALVADLAHELRTPLTVLGGLAEELREEGRPGELVASLERQVRRLRAFAEELEELAAIEAGQLRLHLEDVDVSTVVAHVLDDLRGEAERAGITLSATGDPAMLRSDPVRLAQVIGNLVSNGIRYNRKDGTVEVCTTAGDGEVFVEVRDSGLGIPVSEIPLVFQRFYRVRRGPQAQGGSGLGLAIVKHLTRALGGGVQLTSQEGAGTAVTLTFPENGPSQA